MDELLARDFNNVAYFRVHRMMVDTYCLHPDRHCLSAKSFTAHLTGLCWLIEQDLAEGLLWQMCGAHRTPRHMAEQ